MSEPLGGLLAAPPSIVAAGVEVFSTELRAQGVSVTDVDWRPPGFGSTDDLAQLALDPRRAAANRIAVERVLAAGSVLTDVRPARELTDPVNGGSAWCNLNEGLGKVLRMGAFNEEVQTRLAWMRDVLGPVLSAAVRSRTEPLDVKAILAQMLQMGDEGHNRNRAGSLMALRELSPPIVAVDAPSSDIAEVLRFIGGNEHFYLNLGMPTAKLALDAARGVPGSTMLTVMARNGTEFGIQTAGTGDRWFTGPAQTPVGLFLGNYGPAVDTPDYGDTAH